MSTKNIVPRNAHEGQIGTAVKPFLKVVADKIAVAGLPIITPPNLISNGEFETNISGWSSDGATITRETSVPLIGTGSLRMVSAANLASTYISQLTVITGHTYVFSGLVKSTAAAGRKCYAFTVVNGATDGASVDCSVTPQVVSCTFTATQTAAAGMLRFGFDGYTAGESFLLESVVCYDLTAWSPILLQAQLDAITDRLTAHSI